MRQGPLAGRYPAVAAMVTLALIPYLALSAAVDPLVPIISEQLSLSAQTMSLGFGLGNAAYAVGTVLAVQFAQHLPQRRMLLAYAVVLVLGSVIAASAVNGAMFIGGHILQGLATSMLLIAAAPPLTIGFPRDKLRHTAVIMNMCVFGAVALGPFIGGAQAEALAWRPLFWIVAGVAVLALIMAALTFEDAPPADLDAPRDLRAIALASVGCAAAFIGAAQLTSHGFTDPAVIVPILGGLALIVVLIAYQFKAARPLLTVRTMLTSSIPVAGVGVALFAAAASVAATALTAEVFMQTYSPVRVGLLYLPELGGAIVMAFVFGAVISKRSMHYLPLVGMGLLAAGIVMFRLAIPANRAAGPHRVGADRACVGRHRRTGIVRRRVLVAVQQPSAGVRDHRVAAGRGRLHGGADLRPLRGHGGRRSHGGCRGRTVGRVRARHRRRHFRSGRLRAQWCPAPDTRPRPVPRR